MSTTDNTTAPDGFDIRDKVDKAWQLGLAVLPVQHDGTKKPRGKWKHLQHERLSLDETQALFTDDDTGFGIICGAVSGNLEMLELEAAAVEGGLLAKVRERLEAAGLLEEFSKILEGCCVETPSGGFHFIYFVEGGPALPNKKIALRLPTQAEKRAGERVIVLIETRGEGGFFVAPSSHGKIHASGKQWKQRTGGLDKIATVTAEVRDAIFDVLRSFDETPKEVDKATGVPLATVTPIEQPWTVTQWYEQDDTSPFDWFRQNHPHIGELLIDDGWTTSNGTSWTRPGKSQREGTSAELHVADDGAEFLNIFSTSIPPEYERAGTPGRPGSPVVVSLSPGQLFAAVHHGGDLSEASRNIRVNWMPRLQPGRSMISNDPATVPRDIDQEEADDGNSSPPSLGMSPSFWNETPWLQAVRDKAWSRLLSPDAVLAALEARVAAALPPTLKIPPWVGAPASFDHLTVIVGRTASGKSAADHAAEELFPQVFEQSINWACPIGSGEGLVESFFENVSEERDDGKKVTERKITKQATHFTVDEMSQFIEIAGRSNTTIAQILCSAWSGKPLGMLNASQERKRIIPAGKVRIAALMATQVRNGHRLLTDNFVELGLTGRTSFFWAEDPNMPDPDNLPDEVDALDISIPPTISTGTWVTAPRSVIDEVRWARHRSQTGEAPISNEESHIMLIRLKRAAMYGYIGGDGGITEHTWDLARQVEENSRRIRAHMRSHAAEVAHAEIVGKGQARGYARLAEEAVIEGSVLNRTKNNILRHLSAAPDKRMARRKLRKKLSRPQGELIETALDELENEGHVERLLGESHSTAGIVVQLLS